MSKKFPIYKQLDSMDCGPTCLKMIAKFYGKSFSTSEIRSACYLTKDGVSLMGISHGAESLGMRTFGAKITLFELQNKAPLPCILHWDNNHFVVVYKIKKNIVHIADPKAGRVIYNIDDFKKRWLHNRRDDVGYTLLVEPTADFYEIDETKEKGWSYFFKYLKPHRKLLIQAFCALLFSSLVSLITPFFTQSLVDIGINGKNLGFIYLILISQLLIILGTAFVNFIQSWIGLHIGTKISIEFVSDFLQKLLKLPISFFETKSIGDILQRMGDHSRIQSFVTSSLFTIVLSVINFITFSVIMLYYNIILFFIFMLGNALYVGWILLFMKKRRSFDFMKFDLNSKGKNVLLQLFHGVEEIKLNNVETRKRWEWENIQAKKFKLGMDMLTWGQFQSSGSLLINSSKNVLISFFSAKAVIDGEMSLGMMMSVQFIIGQLQVPIKSFISLAYQHQDAKISVERLGEVHNTKDEEHNTNYHPINIQSSSIYLENVSFQYEGPESPFVLKDVNLEIPKNKVTAIVGESGSGKTTLLKLLLKFLEPTTGSIKVGDFDLSAIRNSIWRTHCGAVLQNGYLFSDTILNNVCVRDEIIDFDRFFLALKDANILKWVESLPQKYESMIGANGRGLSQGQKQRIIIARLFYNDPDFVFLDEATNSLDASSEAFIMGNFNRFCKNKTTIVIAHRLSTVKNADQIILLRNGQIIEVGTHNELIENNGAYMDLVKSQLSDTRYEFS